MLYFAPRNKASTTFYAWMVELVDTTDLKSVDPKGRAGSSPAPGTKREIAAMRSPVFGLSIRIEHLITPSAPPLFAPVQCADANGCEVQDVVQFSIQVDVLCNVVVMECEVRVLQ